MPVFILCVLPLDLLYKKKMEHSNLEAEMYNINCQNLSALKRAGNVFEQEKSTFSGKVITAVKSNTNSLF